ncbi:hypothetical protein E2C01_045916 [Portunus trituberculatus]|uniref:Uncharacterized protein n=1 Tax=Portunus trituberculatus TaxID=210409 RepID=A0A5B7G2N4_PORTR|nr:hypothetical protein [Portunus trituberculatus]
MREVVVAVGMVPQPLLGTIPQMMRMPIPHLEKEMTGPGTKTTLMMMMKTSTYTAIQGEADKTTTMLMRAQGQAGMGMIMKDQEVLCPRLGSQFTTLPHMKLLATILPRVRGISLPQVPQRRPCHSIVPSPSTCCRPSSCSWVPWSKAPFLVHRWQN